MRGKVNTNVTPSGLLLVFCLFSFLEEAHVHRTHSVLGGSRLPVMHEMLLIKPGPPAHKALWTISLILLFKVYFVEGFSINCLRAQITPRGDWVLPLVHQWSHMVIELEFARHVLRFFELSIFLFFKSIILVHVLGIVCNRIKKEAVFNSENHDDNTD